jgi:hypothetical protein
MRLQVGFVAEGVFICDECEKLLCCELSDVLVGLIPEIEDFVTLCINNVLITLSSVVS